MKDIGIEQHSVRITLDEKDNKFNFNTKNEKDEFIKSENKFCLKEYETYTCAFDVLERKLFKVELEKKRMAHAVHCGFHQVAKTGVWNRSSKIDAILA